jgi:indolepyruvate decarboxylase
MGLSDVSKQRRLPIPLPPCTHRRRPFHGAGVRVAIESADCLLCVGVRFTDVATGFFSHRLQSEELIRIRAFDLTIGTTHMPGVAGSELLSALLYALPLKPRRIRPQRLKPPTRLPSRFGQSLTQDRFWQRMQDFVQAGDVVLADIGTCSAGMAGLRMPDGVAVVGQPLWAAVGYALPALLGTLLAAPRRRQLLFIGDGAFQMTGQELSTILRRGLKPIIFLVNNNGYTIERLILGPGSSYKISINGDTPKPLPSSTRKIRQFRIRPVNPDRPRAPQPTRLWRAEAVLLR